ncbi:hypothetical protein Clacol_002428 [Clathrus columnatus]|uniref:UDENN domain-containing protein n=1 Tax=Clathrus columnatus TaxID=1419009 RepID=A0AAV5A0U4_9AGAM|nr:hypothetical protein Clacol_002428 [Clathrus columnatus]
MDDEIDIGTIRFQNTRKNSTPIGSLFRFSVDSSFSYDATKLVGSVKEEKPPEPPPDSFLHPLEQDKLNNLKNWIYGIAVGKSSSISIVFVQDLLTCCTNSELRSRHSAFSSFPDSAAFDTGMLVHSFEISLFLEEHNTSTTYGFACFSQMKDSTSRRGYVQIIKLLASRFISLGYPALDQACRDISEWPAPNPNQSLHIPFLGETFQIKIPASDDEVQITELSNIHEPLHTPLLACIPPLTPPSVAVLSSCLPSLWSIWELLLLREPIFVHGPNPRITSLAIWWMRDVIRPIPLLIDFRPYITIHDRDFASLVNKHAPRTGLIVGATNPFISSSTKHWPHRLMLGEINKNELIYNKSTKPSHEITGALGFTSRTHKRYTSKDRPLLASWEDAISKGGHHVPSEIIASQSLRQHFSSRTALFLVPLNRYLNSLIPTPAQVSQKSTLQSRLRTFSTADFLKSLVEHGTPLPFKSSSKRQEFYTRWLKTPAFGRWLAAQDEIVSDMLRERNAIH